MTDTAAEDRAIRLARRMWDSRIDLRILGRTMSRYRFVRAVQIGNQCPGYGRSCVEYPCLCVTMADELQPKPLSRAKASPTTKVGTPAAPLSPAVKSPIGADVMKERGE